MGNQKKTMEETKQSSMQMEVQHNSSLDIARVNIEMNRAWHSSLARQQDQLENKNYVSESDSSDSSPDAAQTTTNKSQSQEEISFAQNPKDKHFDAAWEIAFQKQLKHQETQRAEFWGALYNPNISWEQCLSLADDPHQYFMTEYEKAKEQISNNEIKVRPSLLVKKTVATEEEAEAKRKSYSLPDLPASFYNARASVTAAEKAMVEATRIGNEMDRTCALERETVSDTDLKSLRLMLSKASSNNNNNSPKSKNNSGRIYVENPSDNDVLFGRGGRSNHHPGNARYRTEVERLSTTYKSTTSKPERLQMTKALAATIRASGGRFLQKERNVWYVVDNEEVVLKKVHQALRENRDPAKRKAKRKRFLERHNKRY